MKNLNLLKPLFWDYDFESVVRNLQSPFVIARLLELGTPEQFEVLRGKVQDEKIIEFLKSERAKRLLSKVSLNFWLLYYGIDT